MIGQRRPENPTRRRDGGFTFPASEAIDPAVVLQTDRNWSHQNYLPDGANGYGARLGYSFWWPPRC